MRLIKILILAFGAFGPSDARSFVCLLVGLVVVSGAVAGYRLWRHRISAAPSNGGSERMT